MAKSFFQMYGHLIFSTKNRVNWLDEEIRDEVYAYISQIFRNQDCPFVHVGGTGDHIHIFFDIGKINLTTKIIGIVKKDSSKFIKTLDAKYKDFYWQNGYALFSVSPTNKDNVINYISIQAEHHKRMTFKEEYLAYLKKYNI